MCEHDDRGVRRGCVDMMRGEWRGCVNMMIGE